MYYDAIYDNIKILKIDEGRELSGEVLDGLLAINYFPIQFRTQSHKQLLRGFV